jgi:hypothetical protein
MMNKLYYIAAFILCVGIAVAADGAIGFFNASSDGSSIKVEWRTSDEAELKKFELERSPKNGSFSKITDIDAKGRASSYSYIDESALKTISGKDEALQGGSSIYSYRIKLVNKDNSATYSNSINVSHTTSGIKRTWGMIKAMFK